MERGEQLSLRDIFRITVWAALASLALRLSFQATSRHWSENLALIALILALLVAPFAATGAMFERAARRILYGLITLLLLALLIQVASI